MYALVHMQSHKRDVVHHCILALAVPGYGTIHYGTIHWRATHHQGVIWGVVVMYALVHMQSHKRGVVHHCILLTQHMPPGIKVVT